MPRLSLLVLLLGLSGCKLGLDYTADETGLERASIQVPGAPERELSYLVHGDPADQRLIFVHGSPGNSQAYAQYMRTPVPGLETVAVDRLGYGASWSEEAVVSFEEQAAAIAPLLVEREGGWPIVVGHSLGGPIAARLAADHPDRVDGLIIVAGSLNAELEDVRWYQRLAGSWIVYPFLADFLQRATVEMFACKEQVELLDEVLDEIRCPVVVIHGTRDGLVPFEAVEYTIERFAEELEVYVVVLVGEGHSVTALRDEEVRETILEMRDHLLRPGELPE